MLKKYCLQCFTYSYSASPESPWYCPTCQTDLSGRPLLEIDEKAPEEREKAEQERDTADA